VTVGGYFKEGAAKKKRSNGGGLQLAPSLKMKKQKKSEFHIKIGPEISDQSLC